MENPKHTFREMNLVRIKSKTDELELSKEKRMHFFVKFILSEGIFLTFVFYLNV